MAMWNPFRGCHKIKEGCLYCYTHTGDLKRNIDTNIITKTDSFDYPIKKNKNGTYKLKPGSLCFVCFTSDFLLEEADEWRLELYSMMKQRSDVQFLFLTKRIDRFLEVLPTDWNDGYDNVTVGVSVSTQKEVDDSISLLMTLPIKHKNIILQPLIEAVNIEAYQNGCELVVVGGEYGNKARPMNYEWVLDIRNQCLKQKTSFEFRQCSTYFIKDGIEYKLKYRELMSQAKKADINLKF